MPGVESGQGVYGSDVTRKENSDWVAGEGADAKRKLNELGQELGRENPVVPEASADEEVQGKTV